MANRREALALVVIGLLTLLVAGGGLFLGFQSPPKPRSGPALPQTPDQGPIVYEMRSIRSDPDRVRLEWRDIPGASGYQVTIMSATDESLFVSPTVRTNAWTIPTELRPRLKRQTVYHWRLTVLFPEGPPRVSDPSAFATQ